MSTTWNEFWGNGEQAADRIAGKQLADDLVERHVGQHIAVVGQEDVLAVQEAANPP